MLKRLLSLGIILGFAFSILLPNSFVHAEAEDDDDATTEEADAEDEEAANEEDDDANEDEEEADDDANEEEEEESDKAPASDDEEEDWSIYFYVIGFMLVLTVGLYAFTEGTKKK